MRILFLALDVDLTLNRGDSVHVRGLAEALARAGNQVHLIVASGNSASNPIGIEVSICSHARNLPTLGLVVRTARAHVAEVVYERRFSPKISAAAGHLLRLPYVVEYNGIPEDELAALGRTPRQSLGQTARTAARLWLLRRADAVVAVTPGVKREIVNRYRMNPEKIFVVENGVDSHQFRPADKARAREQLGLPRGPIICFVGNLVRWQGLDCLLEAMTAVRPGISLIILGDGPDRDRLADATERLHLGKRVLFQGDVPHVQVPVYIAAADVCVAPFAAARNRLIGVSALKVLEYVACARPIIVSDIEGPNEIVRRYGCGEVVPPDDPDAWANAIEKVVDDNQISDAALRASTVVRTERSWDRAALQLGQVLEFAKR